MSLPNTYFILYAVYLKIKGPLTFSCLASKYRTNMDIICISAALLKSGAWIQWRVKLANSYATS